MKKERIVILIEVLLVFLGLLYYVVKIMVPEYKESHGSSDSFIRSGKCQNFIEIKIDQVTDFMIILDSEGKIYHLFFFDNSSVVLYNKNIENQTIEVGLEKMIPILIENNLLRSGSSIEIIRSKDDFYSDFQNSWNALIRKYSIHTSPLEKVVGIDVKASELGIDTTSYSSMILDIDFYSKEIIKNYVEQKIYVLDSTSSRECANSVYMKIEKMVLDDNIQNIDRDKVDLVISMIPADKDKHYYPTTKSWYYVKDSRVYAYIEFVENEKSYSYCYQGSIDSRMEGECKS